MQHWINKSSFGASIGLIMPGLKDSTPVVSIKLVGVSDPIVKIVAAVVVG